MLLPLIWEGRDGEFPVRNLFCRHSVLDTESPELGWDWAPSPDWKAGMGNIPQGFSTAQQKIPLPNFYKSSCIISTTISPGCIFKITFPFLTSGIELILIGSTF